jgi:cation-transporting ATPase E
MCALWTLLVLARPLAGWKLLLVAGMAGLVAVVVIVPALATGVFLMHPTPLRVTVAAVVGGVGVLIVELTHRSVAFATRRHGGIDGGR